MLKTTYLRQCAHNLNERTTVREALSERGISKPRKLYLQNQLLRLNHERDFFVRIKKEFVIRPHDCFRL